MNMPCAVSGRRKPCSVPSGPICVENIRLNGNGCVSGLPVASAVTPYFANSSSSWSAVYESACRRMCSSSRRCSFVSVTSFISWSIFASSSF